MTNFRSDALSWDEYFMAVAKLSALRSKDPNTQVGACIVDKYNHIVGTGYNGFPTGISNYELPWGRTGDFLEKKYAYMCHAESNAIDNGDCGRVKGGRIYVTLFPCNECAKRIIQNRISEVIYLSDKYHDSDESKAARKMFELSKTKTKKYPNSGATREILIRLP